MIATLFLIAQVTGTVPFDSPVGESLGGRGISENGLVLQLGTGAVLRSIESKLRDTVSVKDFAGINCDGSNDDAAGFVNANAAANTAGASLLVNCKVRIASAAGTISAPLKFEGAGALDLSPAAGSVTITGAMTAPLSKIFFTGSGTLTLGAKTPQIVPQWWGAVGDGVTNDQPAIQAALNSGTKGVFLNCATYATTTTISIPATVSLTGEIRPCATIAYSGSGWAVDFNDIQNGRIDNLTIQLTSAALGGVRLRAQNTTAETRHVLNAIAVTATLRTASQIGFLFSTESAVATLYHNRILDGFCNQMDICVKFTSTSNIQGPDGNLIDGLGTQGQGTGILLTDGVDNAFTGMIFLGTSVANATAIKITAGGGNFGVAGNTFSFISEQGVGSATTINVASGAGTTGGNGNNIFTGYANDATQITDVYGGAAVNANKYFLNTGILVPRIQGSPPTAPLLLYGVSAGSVMVGDGTAQPSALPGLGITESTGSYLTVGDATREAFIGADASGLYVGSLSAHDVLLRVGNATKATLNTSGNLVMAAGGVMTADRHTVVSTTGGGTITLTTGSGTATVFTGARCVCTDTTANASVKCAVATTTLTATGTGSDVIAYFCY